MPPCSDCPDASWYFPTRRRIMRLFHRNRVRADRCVMVEDTLANLKTAKKLGMATVWVARSAKTPGYVDLSVRNLMQLPRLAWRLK